MNLLQLTPNQSLNKAYRKEKVGRADIERFKTNLKDFLDSINEKESEEHVKNNVTKFLYDTYYNGKNQVNTKGRIDLAIYENKKPVVLFEAKRPGSADMVTVSNLNTKAFHELILYYLRERIEETNTDIKYLMATDMHQWFIFDAVQFDRLFYQNNQLTKEYVDWKNGRKADTSTEFFYSSIAAPVLKNFSDEISFTQFDLREFEKIVRNEDQKDDVKLVPLFKLLSPAHLLKQPFANDSNSLDTKFYSELLHIIGLEEKKDGGRRLIHRKETPDPGSLLENAITVLEAEDRLRQLPREGADFGEKKPERLFNIALELCITWINRVLFLKLLEGQLVNYHAGDSRYRFLDFKTVPTYDELNKLFFQVLAQKYGERSAAIREKFQLVPYLNSSLFEISSLEADTLRINSLDDSIQLKIFKSTVLKDNSRRREGEMPTLQYLFEFLSAYDFTSEGKEEIQEENKGLINASVLGLIFEKINGYKDGSFFTPGFITMYMCRETIRRAIVQKFNEAKGWKVESLDDLHNQIKDVKEANAIINSLKICDPAVGSGHFLVSALNEIIAIKSELHVLTDRDGKLLRDYNVQVVNDELMVEFEPTEFFEYRPGNKESQRVQEALFHEKQSIIENCLFGVDINPNSVKICRLRLWIELLKNAYYTAESKYKELETLPNIDINIKRGNSLISRFSLDADLSKALKSIKYNIDDYRAFVNSYKNATDKEEKRGFEKLIELIKGDFRTEIGKNDPKIIQRNKKAAELHILLTQVAVFEPSEKERKSTEKKKAKLEEEINKLSAEIREIQENAIYRDAFEWRFEFPEVLNSDGRFTGFDVIVGNPPWGISVRSDINRLIPAKYQSIQGTDADSYSVFTELGLRLTSIDARLAFITPDSFLRKDDKDEFRRLLLDKYEIEEIVETGPVFSEVPDIWCSILRIRNRKAKDYVINHRKLGRFIVSIRERLDLFVYEKWEQDFTVASSVWRTCGYVFGHIADERLYRIMLKMVAYPRLGNAPSYEISRGEEGGKGKFTESINGDFYLVNPEHVYEYYTENGTLVDSKLLTPAKLKRFYSRPKLWLIRIQKLRWKQRIVCGLDERTNSAGLKTLQVIVASEGDVVKLLALHGILSSKLMNFWCVNYLSDDMNQSYLEKLPIKSSDKFNKQIANAVRKINAMKLRDINADTTEAEKELNELVYALYEISKEEAALVETNPY